MSTPDLAISTAAAAPVKAEADGVMAQAQKLPDLIAAEQYLAAKSASRKTHRGLRFTKLIGPPQCPADPGGGSDPSFGGFQ